MMMMLMMMFLSSTTVRLVGDCYVYQREPGSGAVVMNERGTNRWKIICSISSNDIHACDEQVGDGGR